MCRAPNSILERRRGGHRRLSRGQGPGEGKEPWRADRAGACHRTSHRQRIPLTAASQPAENLGVFLTKRSEDRLFQGHAWATSDPRSPNPHEDETLVHPFVVTTGRRRSGQPATRLRPTRGDAKRTMRMGRPGSQDRSSRTQAASESEVKPRRKPETRRPSL